MLFFINCFSGIDAVTRIIHKKNLKFDLFACIAVKFIHSQSDCFCLAIRSIFIMNYADSYEKYFWVFRAGEIPPPSIAGSPLVKGGKNETADKPLTLGAQRNTAFSPLNKGGCPKDKGDLPTSMSLRRSFLHALREKALVTAEFAADSGRVIHTLLLIFNFFSKRMNNPG